MILTTRNFGPSPIILRGIVYVLGVFRSLIITKNSKGSSLDPWGTPAVIGIHLKKGKKEIAKQLAQESNFKLSSNRVDELFIRTVIYWNEWRTQIFNNDAATVTLVDENVSSHFVATLLGFEERRPAACSSLGYNEI